MDQSRRRASFGISGTSAVAELQALSEMCFRFGMAGLALDICGPAAWIQPLQVAWTQWEPSLEVIPWRVSVSPDTSLTMPDAPLFAARPRCRDGVCTLTSAGFRGKVNAADGIAQLHAHPDATPADVGYFVRVALALQAFARGGMLFHAAGVLHREQGYAFFGLSGSGKTTAAQFSTPDPVLNDDLLLLWPAASWLADRRHAVWETPW